mmetsp:Transcript_12463/g.34607  ORF Transcript_12463/g.34607 Transcript_12463/m.34607 type:complete len:133 (-) Transcript_12463:1442-1840(-)
MQHCDKKLDDFPKIHPKFRVVVVSARLPPVELEDQSQMCRSCVPPETQMMPNALSAYGVDCGDSRAISITTFWLEGEGRLSCSDRCSDDMEEVLPADRKRGEAKKLRASAASAALLVSSSIEDEEEDVDSSR